MKIAYDEAAEELTIKLELKKLPSRWHPWWIVVAAKVVLGILRG